MLFYSLMTVWATTYGEPPGPDGELRFHHSQLDKLKTVTASSPSLTKEVRCPFEVRIDESGVPRPGSVLLRRRNHEECDPEMESLAREALLEWRFLPMWVRGSYVPARTIVTMQITNTPPVVWTLPIDRRVCALSI